MVTQNIQDCDIKFLIATHYTNSVKNDWLIFKINDFILLNFLFFIFFRMQNGNTSNSKRTRTYPGLINFFFKGTVNIISSDLQSEALHKLFTTIPSSPLLYQVFYS